MMMQWQSAISDPSQKGERVVLVVDDDDAVLNSIRFVLQVEGFTVGTYASAEALLAAMVPPYPACLVIDQQLPGRSGLELISELREQGYHLPVILITTRLSPSLRQKAHAAQVAIVEKPLLGDDLTKAIGRALG